jgi:hypothetical protein
VSRSCSLILAMHPTQMHPTQMLPTATSTSCPVVGIDNNHTDFLGLLMTATLQGQRTPCCHRSCLVPGVSETCFGRDVFPSHAYASRCLPSLSPKCHSSSHRWHGAFHAIQAEEAVRCLNKPAIDELKSFGSPAAAVLLVVKTILTLYKGEKRN